MRREERVKLSDGSLVPVSQGITVPIAEWQALKAQVEEGTLYNTEEIITESGEWEAPVTGWYEVTVIGGGSGAFLDSRLTRGEAGKFGNRKTVLAYYQKGQQIAVTIGAGGLKLFSELANMQLTYGGPTSFGEIASTDADSWVYSVGAQHNISGNALQRECGRGPNGGIGSENGTISNNGRFPGGGGGYGVNGTTGAYNMGDGAPGAAIIRYYDKVKS